MTSLTVNLDNLSEEERKTLTSLIEKANKPTPKPIIERGDKKTGYYSINSFFNVFNDLECGFLSDNNLYFCYNYYIDKDLCLRVADYLKNTHLFTRKAIEFAQGYEWKSGDSNYFVCPNGCNFSTMSNHSYKNPTTIYMTGKQAEAFAKWCDEHKRELGYD